MKYRIVHNLRHGNYTIEVWRFLLGWHYLEGLLGSLEVAEKRVQWYRENGIENEVVVKEGRL